MNGMFSDRMGKMSHSQCILTVNIGTVQAFGNAWSVGPIDFRLFDVGSTRSFVDVMHQECVQLLKVVLTRPSIDI